MTWHNDSTNHLPVLHTERALAPSDGLPPLLPPSRLSRRALKDLTAYQDYARAYLEFLTVQADYQRALERLRDVPLQAEAERLQWRVQIAQRVKELAAIQGDTELERLRREQQLALLQKLRSVNLQDDDELLKLAKLFSHEQLAKLLGG